MGLVTISGRGVRIPADFSVTFTVLICTVELVVISLSLKEWLFTKTPFFLQYLCELLRTLMDEVLETFRDLSSYGFYVWSSQPVKAIGQKTWISHRRRYRGKRNEKEDKDKNHMEIVKIRVENKANGMSVKNNTAASFRVFNMNDHLRAKTFARIEQIEIPYIPLYDICLSHITFCAHHSARTISIVYWHTICDN